MTVAITAGITRLNSSNHNFSSLGNLLLTSEEIFAFSAGGWGVGGDKENSVYNFHSRKEVSYECDFKTKWHYPISVEKFFFKGSFKLHWIKIIFSVNLASKNVEGIHNKPQFVQNS